MPEYVKSHLGVVAGLASLLFPAAGFAQGGAAADTATIDDLRAPPSPAFVLLGVEPSSVERPGTPRALAASIVSATKNADLIPRDYALDFGPYWLFPHPDLTFDRFMKAGLGRTLLQTLSLSLATSQLGGDGANGAAGGGTAIGFGFRTQALAGRPGSAIARAGSGLRKELEEIQGQILEAETEAEEDSLVRLARVVALQIQRETRRPVGFLVEVAGGITALFPGDDFEAGRVGRIGAWITPSYRLERPKLDIIAVGRYLRDEALEQDLVDVGARLLFEIGNIALSAEFVERLRSGEGDPGDTERYAILADYRLKDDLFVTASFGKGYSDPGGGDPLIAVLGINFGFGKSRAVKFE